MKTVILSTSVLALLALGACDGASKTGQNDVTAGLETTKTNVNAACDTVGDLGIGTCLITEEEKAKAQVQDLSAQVADLSAKLAAFEASAPALPPGPAALPAAPTPTTDPARGRACQKTTLNVSDSSFPRSRADELGNYLNNAICRNGPVRPSWLADGVLPSDKVPDPSGSIVVDGVTLSWAPMSA